MRPTQINQYDFNQCRFRGPGRGYLALLRIRNKTKNKIKKKY